MSRTRRDYWLRKAHFEICVLGRKVEDAQLSGDVIKGTWAHTGTARPLSAVLVEEFLNYPRDPAAILKFTRRYGPIDGPRSGNKPWKVKLSRWTMYQGQLQGIWNLAAGVLSSNVGGKKTDIVATDTEPGEELVFDPVDGIVRFEVRTLERFLFLSLMSFPSNRLKKCARPVEEGCLTPFFFANHLRQEYCSGPCAGWGKTKAKREWWHRRLAEQKGGRRKK